MNSLTYLSTAETDPEEPELGVLLTGGRNSTSSLQSAEFFGSQSCAVHPLPEPRSGHVSFVTPNGTIAVCGGWTVYDGQEASKTSDAPTPTPSATAQAPIPQLGGVVTSPNYPGSYTSDFDKIFTIEGSPAKILQLTFVDFDIEESYIFYDYESYDYDSQSYDWDYNRPSCPHDWLQVTISSFSDAC